MMKLRILFLIVVASVMTVVQAAGQSCSISVGEGCDGDDIRFSLSCGTRTFNEWTWEIDGIIDLAKSPSMTLSKGSYRVEVQALCSPEGSGQCSPVGQVGASRSFTVSPKPALPVISASSASVCDGSTVTLSITNSDPNKTYVWTANGANAGTGTTITPVVTQTTVYVVEASRSGTNGRYCKTSASVRIEAGETQFVPKVLSSAYHKVMLGGGIGSGGASDHYWQQTTGGQSLAHPLSQDFGVVENGRYMLRKFIAAVNCWTTASTPIDVVVPVVPPVAVIAQLVKPGNTQIRFVNDDAAHILSYADYYWVSSASGTEMTTKFNDGYRLYEAGVYYLRGRDRGTGTWGGTVAVTVAFRDDDALNWIHTRVFDGTYSGAAGQPQPVAVGETRDYYDENGTLLQSQTKHVADNLVFITQPLTDKLDRPVGATLPAPASVREFRYNGAWMLAPDGRPYTYDYFKHQSPVDLNSDDPEPVAIVSGTLGWYYSARNKLESHVPVTSYPYSRNDFYADGTEVRKSSSPGDQHRMNTGHEMVSGTFPVTYELNDYLGKRRAAGFSDRLEINNSLAGHAVQTVVRDVNGKYSVSIADQNGNGVMTARAGTATDHMLSVTNTKTVAGDPSKNQIVYFYLLNDAQVTLSPSGSVDFLVEDILNDLRPQRTYADPGNDDKWPAGFYRIVMKPSASSTSLALSYTNHFQDVSYSFYDDAGRLNATISPNAYKVWSTGTAYAGIEKTTYSYNFRGWLLSSTNPDAGKSQFKYRTDGKIRFSQNAQQACNEDPTCRENWQGEGRFSYTRYDNLGRPVESGEYTGLTYTFASVNNQLEFASQLDYGEDERTDWLKVTYDFPDGTVPYLPAAFRQRFVRGAVSSTENINSKTWYSYDELGRVTWMAQKPAALDRTFITEYTYDFMGNVLTVANASYDDQGRKRDAFYHHYEYDTDKRLYKSYTSLSGTDQKLRATYTYYLHGPLKRIVLGDKLQGIDFVYNINGWLTQINHPDRSKDPHGDKDDVFGMVLDYYESDMTGIFPVAAAASPGVDPHQFHKLPATLDPTASPDVAVDRKPAYRQQMMEALDIMKSLSAPREHAVSAPVTLDYFKSTSTDQEPEPSAGEESPTFAELNMNLAETATASTSADLYGPTAVVDVVPDAVEFAVLKAIYDNMGGATTWTTKTNWPSVWPASATSAQFGTWFGVTVANGDIVRIVMPNNRLTGALVPDIGLLTQLERIQIHGNAISAIPAEIGQLTRVLTLYLNNNAITSIPQQITGMTALRDLRLQFNSLSGEVPSFLGSIHTLNVLFLNNNAFTGGVPASFNELTALTNLDLHSNALTGPISDLSALQQLTNLSLQQNQIQGLPVHLGNLSALRTLYVNDNNLTGIIPPEFNNLTQLVNLNLSDNALEGEIPDLNNLTNLVKLDLSDNALQGEIPDLSNLTQLQNLILNGNKLQGAIPATLGNLAGLLYLYLHENELEGEIPPELARLSKLTRLYLYSNQLTGELPPVLRDLSALQDLQLSGNHFSGPLPPSWANLTELSSINLTDNQLSGTLPEAWNNLTRLVAFYCGGNQLEGSIPASYSALVNLVSFRVGDNKLSGEIPSSLFSGWPKLISLYLNNNNFSGAFPASIGACTLVQTLEISYNNFVSLPGTLLSLPLTGINARNNKLKSIPDFAAHPNKGHLSVYLRNNWLDMTVWEPYFTIAGGHGIRLLEYYPQSVFNDPPHLPVPAGTALVIQARPKGQHTSVTWQKKSGSTWVSVDANNEDATRQVFRISAPQQGRDDGTYRWRETDTSVPSLLLEGQVVVKIVDELPDPQSTSAALYNGLIRSVYWRTDQPYGTTGGEEYAGVYRFEYDDKYQVSESRWGDPNRATWTSFTDAGNKYRLVGMTYDPNGNIQTLRRYADDGFIKNDLVYAYFEPGSKNRLTYVRDDGGDDQSSRYNSYAYDAIGRTTAVDAWNWGKNQYIEYDVAGKVRHVYLEEWKATRSVSYLYDDRGFRLAKIDYQSKKTTWYIRDAAGKVLSVYEQTGYLPDKTQGSLVLGNTTNIFYDRGTLKVDQGYTSATASFESQIAAQQDGYLEYWISGDNHDDLSVGFRVPGSATGYYFDIDDATSTIVMRREGVSLGSFTYTPHSKLKLRRVGDEFRFYYNNALKTSLTVAGSGASPLEPYVSLNSATSTVNTSDLAFYTKPAAAPAPPITLQEIPVYGAGKLGTYYPQQDGSMAYEVTDHLGNVRALVRDHVNTYTATLEDSGVPDATNPRVEELSYFSNIAETVVTDPRMNYSPADLDRHVDTPSKAAYLFWQDGMTGMEAADKSVGPAIGLKVNAGDKLDLETWVRYEKKTVYTNNVTLAVLSQALGTAFAYRVGFEAFTPVQTANALSTALVDGGFGNANPDDTRPYAYLNYLLFDEDNQFVTGGFQRVCETAGFEPGGEGLPNNRSHDRLAFEKPIQVNQAGSVYIWVSNESEDTRVWFDDLKVTRTTSFVTQATDYGVWGDVLREQKSDDSKYRFGYQGQFAERDEETGWNHFELREYDPVIGRWTATDPYGQYWSPYVGMGNDPINGVDEDGGLFGKARAQFAAFLHGGSYDMDTDGNWYATWGDGNDGSVHAGNYGNTNIEDAFVKGFVSGAEQTWGAVKHEFTLEGTIDRTLMMVKTPEKMINLSIAAYDVVSKIPDYTSEDYAFGAGYLTEKALEIYLTKKVAASGLSPKVLRGQGGGINGFTISRGSGYGAKPRFDVHPLGNASKAKNSMPFWTRGKTLPHYHRGKGNSLHRHRPWEKGWNDKNFRDRF